MKLDIVGGDACLVQVEAQMAVENPFFKEDLETLPHHKSPASYQPHLKLQA